MHSMFGLALAISAASAVNLSSLGTNHVVNFDDLNYGDVLTQHEGLTYEGLMVYNTSRLWRDWEVWPLVTPQSKPNFIGPNLNEFRPSMRIHTRGTETAAFDLHDLWVACYSVLYRKGADYCDLDIYVRTVGGQEKASQCYYRPWGNNEGSMFHCPLTSLSWGPLEGLTDVVIEARRIPGRRSFLMLDNINYTTYDKPSTGGDVLHVQ